MSVTLGKSAGRFRTRPAYTEAPAQTFDPAIMQAMNWAWPTLIQAQPKIVESGLKPSDQIPQ